MTLTVAAFETSKGRQTAYIRNSRIICGSEDLGIQPNPSKTWDEFLAEDDTRRRTAESIPRHERPLRRARYVIAHDLTALAPEGYLILTDGESFLVIDDMGRSAGYVFHDDVEALHAASDHYRLSHP